MNETKKEKIDLNKITLAMVEEEANDCEGSEEEQAKIREQLDIAWKVFNVGNDFNNEAFKLESGIGYDIGSKIYETFISDIKDYIIHLSTKLVVHKVVYNTIQREQKEITYD